MIYEIDEFLKRNAPVRRSTGGVTLRRSMLGSPLAMACAAVAFVGATAFAPLLMLGA